MRRPTSNSQNPAEDASTLRALRRMRISRPAEHSEVVGELIRTPASTPTLERPAKNH